jgi:hypothetical protein
MHDALITEKAFGFPKSNTAKVYVEDALARLERLQHMRSQLYIFRLNFLIVNDIIIAITNTFMLCIEHFELWVR